MKERENALVALANFLRSQEYSFTTVTPDTHKRVLARSGIGTSLADIFGWSKVFPRSALPPAIVQGLADAGELESRSGLLHSRVRYSSLSRHLFVHSSFPTTEEDAVFFGPDSYRFVRVIQDRVGRLDFDRFRTVIDVGAGTGVGGVCVASALGQASQCQIFLSDINERALSFSRANCAINSVTNAQSIKTDVLSGLPKDADLIISNPPYLVDAQKRVYRHGGGEYGFDLSLRIVSEAIEHLRSGGQLVLYSGTPVVEGRDLFRDALARLIKSPHLATYYEEIDPDVFGEELERPPYYSADRIAVVALTLVKT